MAERPGGRGPTLYEVAGWLQGAVGVPFRAAGWLSRRDKPEIDRNDWRLARLGIALGAILGLLALTLLTRTLLIAFGLIDGVDRWSELRNSLLVIGVIVGAPFVVWRTMIADRQTAINQQTHYTDLYTKAVEMLGADKVEKRDGKERSVPNIEVRLGAIYALQRVMNQSDADYLPILKTLCAYVRENATFQERPSFSEGAPLPEPPEPPKGREETPEELRERLEAIRLHARNLQAWGERLRWNAAARGADSAQRPDIRAALDVLCERPEKRRLALEGIDRVAPPALDMDDWPDHPANERVQAWLDRIKAHREKLRDWTGSGVRLDLAAAALQGAARSGADLRRANLSGAQMQGADLRYAQMQGANLSEAQMQAAHLSGAQMQGANLSEAQMQAAHLSKAQMQAANLICAQMQGTDLSRAAMQRAHLSGARMQGAHVYSAEMQGADLSQARMEGAFLREAKMQRADISYAQMRGANLSGARLDAALLASTILTGVLDLTFNQLASAFGDAATKLPPDLEAQRPRLIAEAGWAEDEIPLHEMEQRWADWRTMRGF